MAESRLFRLESHQQSEESETDTSLAQALSKFLPAIAVWNIFTCSWSSAASSALLKGGHSSIRQRDLCLMMTDMNKYNMHIHMLALLMQTENPEMALDWVLTKAKLTPRGNKNNNNMWLCKSHKGERPGGQGTRELQTERETGGR